MIKASELFIKCLEEEKVEYIFGVPGEENLDFLESLRTSNIKLILTRHEQAAAFMAATYGRLTGKAGVCLSTLGPGATNFVTGTAYAQLGAMPIIMISGQKPIKHSKQGKFQVLDVVALMKPITKFSQQIISAERIPSLIREAFRISEEERPGAVYLELPEDIAGEMTEYNMVFKKSFVRRPEADKKSIVKAAKYIKNAKNPLILVGAAANRNTIAKQLKSLIEETKILFFNTQMGKGVIGQSDYYLGTASLSSNDYLHCAIGKADLIINIGHDVIEKPPFFMNKEQKVIHINCFSAEVDQVYFPECEVVGDIASTLKNLRTELDGMYWDQKYAKKIREEVQKHIHSKDDDKSFPIIPQQVVKVVRDVMPSDSIVTLDNGVYKIWFARNYSCHAPNSLLLDNALATMGAGLPSAIGAKIVHPKKDVITVCGDGGFMMNSQELETAVRLKLNITVIVLRDNAYGMIKWKQAGMGFENWGLDYGNPDFVAYAESYGAEGFRVKSFDDFSLTLKKCLKSKKVSLIELPVDYSENEKVLIKELTEKSCLL